ncbi:MAG: hypothetical protein WB508_05820, partial [Aeromicrobium sp.]|uniref:DUF6923 family protein n=1 Tax=Aeromicrobium sp. TaxID=1871063 RepID=UPI003C5673C2
MAGGMLASTALMLHPQPAQAAPGDAFEPTDPVVYISQRVPTQLFEARQSDAGLSFSPAGGPSAFHYNGIAYRASDQYIYAADKNDEQVAALVRIGQGGAITELGEVAGVPSPWISATFGEVGTAWADTLLVQTADALFQVNVDTLVGTRVGDTTYTSDIAMAGGFLWAMNEDGIVRIDPDTAATDVFDPPFQTEVSGGAWTYGNGNLGFSANYSGTLRQVAVAAPDSTSPTFTLVSAVDGPSSNTNDGTAISGVEADLDITKEAPE